MKDISLRLTPIFASGPADKAIAAQQKALNSTQTTMDRINKGAKKGLKEQEDSWHRLTKATTEFGRATLRAFDSALSGINGFQRKTEGLIKSVFSLKNVIMGSVVGAGAIGLGKHILSAGAGDVRNKRMLDREFGAGLLRDSVMKHSKSISAAAGIEDDDALVGLLPIARAIRETKIGDRAGGKTIRTRAQLEAVQSSQFSQAANRFKQLAVLNPNMSPEQIGFLLAEAGQGEEGLRGLGRALNLGKASMADIMRDGKKNKSGVGDMVGTMFQRAGYTDGAVKAEQGSFEFQLKQLGTAANTVLGDIGSKAIDKINERLGKGATLAERFGKLFTPEKIEKWADSLATVVEKIGTLVEKIPKALSWLDDHKATLLTLAGAWGGLRVVGGARNLIGGAFGGTAGKVVDAVTGGEGQRVYVTNWPGMPGGGGSPGGPSPGSPGGPSMGSRVWNFAKTAASSLATAGAVPTAAAGALIGAAAIPFLGANIERAALVDALTNSDAKRAKEQRDRWASIRKRSQVTAVAGDGESLGTLGPDGEPIAAGGVSVNVPVTVHGALTEKDIHHVGERVKENLRREVNAQYPVQ